MGWREVLKRLHVMPGVLLAMPPADRIALARELLKGTQRVVAEPIDRRHTTTPVDGYNAGWNAALAAMLGDEG